MGVAPPGLPAGPRALLPARERRKTGAAGEGQTRGGGRPAPPLAAEEKQGRRERGVGGVGDKVGWVPLISDCRRGG